MNETRPPDREWFVSYDVTARSVVLQCVGEDEHQISSEEAMALRDDLLAAAVAANEHRVLLGVPGVGPEHGREDG